MSVLIKNARVVDGINDYAPRANIFIKEDKIVAIAPDLRIPAEIVIEAEGGFCLPGLIDAHTYSDRFGSLVKYPNQDYFLRQGVTTIVGGVRGVSIAPFYPKQFASKDHLWDHSTQHNLNWGSFSDCKAQLTKIRFGTNVAMMVGANGYPPTNELNQKILAQSLDSGAVGISYTLGESGQDDKKNINLLDAIASSAGKILSLFYNPEKIDNQTLLGLLKTISKKRKNPISLTPLEAENQNQIQKTKTINDLLENERIYIAQHPSASTYKHIGDLLPFYTHHQRKENIIEQLRDPWHAKRLINEMPGINGNEWFLVHAPNRSFWANTSIENLKKNNQLPTIAHTLLHIAKATDMGAVLIHIPQKINSVLDFISHPQSYIASGSSHHTIPHDFLINPIENHTPWKNILFQFANIENNEERKTLVTKMTSIPANLFQITGRGQIIPGAFADLVVINTNGAIKQVIVNGKIGFDGTKQTIQSSGRFLTATV